MQGVQAMKDRQGEPETTLLPCPCPYRDNGFAACPYAGADGLCINVRCDLPGREKRYSSAWSGQSASQQQRPE